MESAPEVSNVCSLSSSVSRAPAFTIKACRSLLLVLAGILAIFPTYTWSSPLPASLFNQLALSCAPSVELRTLRAVAAVESHFEPWAIRDNTTRETWMPQSLISATILAQARLDKGHSIDVGLMQINSGNLASLRMEVSDALDPCHSLNAAGRILQSAFAAGSSQAERQAALLITLSRYNTGHALAGIANGYVEQVIAQQGSPDSRWKVLVEAPETQQPWNVWSNASAQTEAWSASATEPRNFERAGAQPTSTRVEERAGVPQLERGEPYELFAYQESETPKP